MDIRQLNIGEKPPMELLLLADPSKEIIEEYLDRGECFVAITEIQHGRGIGKQLVISALNAAKIRGYKTIEIGTGNSSIGQLALYQKCGFRIIGVDTDYFIRHYPEEIFENGIQCRDMIRLSQDL